MYYCNTGQIFRICFLSMYSTYARDFLCMVNQQLTNNNFIGFYLFFQAYARSKDFHYPLYQIVVSGKYIGKWWEESPQEQEQLLKKYVCNVEQRMFLVPLILAPKLTTGKVVSNYSAVTDNGYACFTT